MSVAKKNSACAMRVKIRIRLPAIHGQRRPLLKSWPNRSLGSVRISGSDGEALDVSPAAAYARAPAATSDSSREKLCGCDGTGTGAGGASRVGLSAGCDLGEIGDLAFSPAAVGSCDVNVAKASNTRWQRPQRTWPLDAWSCSRETRKYVSQCGQCVYMLIGRTLRQGGPL